jgi:hypothetical protein
MRGPRVTSDGLYVLRWIQRHGKREFTKSEAQQHGKRRFPRAEDIDPAINELVRRGYVRQRPMKPSGPGRPPSPTYEVNPAVFEIENARNRSRYSKNSGSEAPEGSFQNIQNVFQQNENQNRVQMVI